MDGKVAKPFIYIIYSILTIHIYTESFPFLLITKFENYYIIFGQTKMRKHEITIAIIRNVVVFWLGYYIYIKVFFYNIRLSYIINKNNTY